MSNVIKFPEQRSGIFAMCCEIHCECGVDGYFVILIPDPELAQIHCPRCGKLHDAEDNGRPPRPAA